mmetsp:Transcript_2511/g.5300  ORF Transcript_2511/g.5300 Transcript_2511/m.5300 type:complete len:262 (+) Transcript_2511:21-806(+)
MAPIPLVKVGVLVLRTIAKPVATRLMIDAKRHPTIEKLCVSVGQSFHQVSSRINILASGYRIVGIPPIPHEQALNDGVSIVSDVLVFCVAGTILWYEYNAAEHSAAIKAAAAQKEKDDAKQDLENRLSSLDTQLLVLADRLQNIEKIQAQEQANNSSGIIPYTWIFGVDKDGRGAGSSSSGALAIKGKPTSNLPSMLEGEDIIDDTATSSENNTTLVAGVVKSAPSKVKSEASQDSQQESQPSAGAGAGAGRTWIDWLMWR